MHLLHKTGQMKSTLKPAKTVPHFDTSIIGGKQSTSSSFPLHRNSAVLSVLVHVDEPVVVAVVPVCEFVELALELKVDDKEVELVTVVETDELIESDTDVVTLVDADVVLDDVAVVSQALVINTVEFFTIADLIASFIVGANALHSGLLSKIKKEFELPYALHETDDWLTKASVSAISFPNTPL